MFEIMLASFTGSPEALLTLIETGECDPLSISVSGLVAQVRGQRDLADERATADLADFVSVGARIALLKSRALLPRPPAPQVAEPEMLDDPAAAEELFRRYRAFKLAAEALRQREQEGLRSYPRLARAPALALPPPPVPGNVTLDRLLAVVQAALRRYPPVSPGDIPLHTVTVRERLDALQALLDAEGSVSFERFIGEARSRLEVVVSFMAVLELIKAGCALAEQETPFGEIHIVSRAPVAAGGA